MSMRLKINGEDRVSTSDPLSPLVDVLRDEFFLTGAKPVCREGFCGACMVLLDGKPVASCLMPAGLATDREVRTVEALAPEGDLSPLQRALGAARCGAMRHVLSGHAGLRSRAISNRPKIPTGTI